METNNLINVTIMYRNSFVGGDGWQYYPMRVNISKNCPVCGKPRAKAYPYHFCEDGEWFTVDKWDNECGHIDKYKDCFFESDKLLKQVKEQSNETAK